MMGSMLYICALFNEAISSSDYNVDMGIVWGR